jgi:hypothetical protein
MKEKFPDSFPELFVVCLSSDDFLLLFFGFSKTRFEKPLAVLRIVLLKLTGLFFL